MSTTFPPAPPSRSSSARSLDPFPPSPDPAYAGPISPGIPRTGSAGGTSRPLLAARSSSTASTTAPKVPNRYRGCELCALVAEARKAYGYAVPNEGDRLEQGQGIAEAGPSDYARRAESSKNWIHEETSGGSVITPTSGSRGRNISSNTTINGRSILYHDPDITIYPARDKERLVGGGKHLIVVVNHHAESVYDFGSTDIPLLSKILEVSRLLLSRSVSSPGDEERIGFVGSLMRDPQSPHSHLHAQAMLGPPDPSLPGVTFWRRNVVFGWGNWWSVEDLRAEIRCVAIHSCFVDRVGPPD